MRLTFGTAKVSGGYVRPLDEPHDENVGNKLQSIGHAAGTLEPFSD